MLIAIVAGCSPRKTTFRVSTAVAAAVSQWRNTFADKDLTMDIFVPADERDAVRDVLNAHANTQTTDRPTHKIVVHDAPYDSTIGWRRWILSALDNRAIDILQLVGHGSFRSDRGVFTLPAIASESQQLSVALSPSKHETIDDAAERSIDATDLGATLTALGAWALLMSAPPENDSPAGLRDLSTTISETRPGVVILHQQRSTQAGDHRASLGNRYQAEESLRMIIGKIPEAPMPDVSCWHPLITAWFTGSDRPADEFDADAALTQHDGTSALIAHNTLSVLAGLNVPAWVASGARTLETLHAQLFSNAAGTPDPDAVDALRSVSNRFNEQVRLWGDEHGGTAIS